MGGRGRNRVLIFLAVAMLLGIGVYLRLWTIDYSISAHDTEYLRKQFDIANKEAMDESAEWRLRYDEEAERASNCAKELEEVKNSIAKEQGDASSFDLKLAMLQKEKASLVKQVAMLREELEVAKLKCNSDRPRAGKLSVG